MPVTSIINSGDGASSTRVQAALVLPDSGTSLIIAGTVQQPGFAAVAISGSPLTMPAAPGSGSIFWNLQVNVQTGVASIQQSTVGDPLPAPVGPTLPLLLGQDLPAPGNAFKGGNPPGSASQSQNVLIFRQTLTSSSPAAAWANTTNQSINNY